jgi:hypothetical protein
LRFTIYDFGFEILRSFDFAQDKCAQNDSEFRFGIYDLQFHCFILRNSQFESPMLGPDSSELSMTGHY